MRNSSLSRVHLLPSQLEKARECANMRDAGIPADERLGSPSVWGGRRWARGKAEGEKSLIDSPSGGEDESLDFQRPCDYALTRLAGGRQLGFVPAELSAYLASTGYRISYLTILGDGGVARLLSLIFGDSRSYDALLLFSFFLHVRIRYHIRAISSKWATTLLFRLLFWHFLEVFPSRRFLFASL